MRNWFSRAKTRILHVLRKIGSHRYEYMQSLIPKDSVERQRWILDGTCGVWSFPPAPCQWLCKRNLNRFHLTCLTCWTRRLFFKKRGHEKLRKYKKVYMANKPPIGYRGIIPVQVLSMPTGEWVGLPMYYSNYGIFIPSDEHGHVNTVKEYIVKFLLTLTERIAEW